MYTTLALLVFLIYASTMVVTVIGKTYIKGLLAKDYIYETNQQLKIRLLQDKDQLLGMLHISTGLLKENHVVLMNSRNIKTFFKPFEETYEGELLICIQDKSGELIFSNADSIPISGIAKTNNEKGVEWSLIEQDDQLFIAAFSEIIINDEILTIGFIRKYQSFNELEYLTHLTRGATLCWGFQIENEFDQLKSKSPMVDCSVHKFIETKSDSAVYFRFRYNSQLYYGGFIPLIKQNNSVLWTGINIPAKEILPIAKNIQGIIMNIGVLAFIIVLIVSFRMSRKYADPLFQLADDSKRIAELNTSKPVKVYSRLIEIQNLSVSIEKIRVELECYLNERKQTEKELVDAREKAIESKRLKTSFLSTMSHELRTPLNAIMGCSEIIYSGLSEGDNQEYAQAIKDNGLKLLRLIEEIMNISQINTQELSPEIGELELDKLVGEVHLLLMEERKAKQKAHLHISYIPDRTSVEKTIYSDYPKIKHIFRQLIKNAIKFTAVGNITYGYNFSDPKCIQFFVKDTGIGICKEKQEIIFDWFRQGDDSDTREYGGLGIGLSLAKGLVNVLGGEIWVESEEGKGAAFYFAIPIQQKNMK